MFVVLTKHGSRFKHESLETSGSLLKNGCRFSRVRGGANNPHGVTVNLEPQLLRIVPDY